MEPFTYMNMAEAENDLRPAVDALVDQGFEPDEAISLTISILDVQITSNNASKRDGSRRPVLL